MDRSPQVVSLHPFKDKDSYLKCYTNAKEAGMYEWAVLPHEDLFGKAGSRSCQTVTSPQNGYGNTGAGKIETPERPFRQPLRGTHLAVPVWGPVVVFRGCGLGRRGGDGQRLVEGGRGPSSRCSS